MNVGNLLFRRAIPYPLLSSRPPTWASPHFLSMLYSMAVLSTKNANFPFFSLTAAIPSSLLALRTLKPIACHCSMFFQIASLVVVLAFCFQIQNSALLASYQISLISVTKCAVVIRRRIWKCFLRPCSRTGFYSGQPNLRDP